MPQGLLASVESRLMLRETLGSRKKESCMDSELDRLKSDIDLRAYACHHGYQLDRKESWRGSSVMRHPNGDKIIIKRGADGHYLYCSVHNGAD